MAREILFRGQNRRKNEKIFIDGSPSESIWVYGGVYIGKYDLSIIYQYEPNKEIIVYTDTLGQFTGFYDSTKWEYLSESEQQEWLKYHTVDEWKGKKIFEGDLIRNQDGDIGRVTWYPEHAAFMVYCLNTNKVHFLYNNDFSKIDVIGNIHDNPELLETATK